MVRRFGDMNRTQTSVGLRCGVLTVATGLALSLSGCTAAIVGLGVVCCATPAVAAVALAGDTGRAEASDATVTIEVPEVECAGCSLEARKAIKSVGGVRHLSEGSPRNRIVVAYESAAAHPEAYVEALHRAGFSKAREVGRN
jgi:hypothetical protein